MAVPMSLATVGDSLVKWQGGRNAHRHNERMTRQTKSRKTKAKLPCQWVEDEGFEVAPAQGPAKEPQALPDTAFLLKSRPLPRPPQLPNS